MKEFVIHAPRLFDGKTIRSEHYVAVRDGLIADVSTTKPSGTCIEFDADSILAPGFIDCQVNGGGGVMLNDEPAPETIATIANAHRKAGTTSFLPTLISDSRDRMRAAITAVDAAIKDGQQGVLGIHLEGPFLNPARKGIHRKERFVSVEQGDADLIASLENGVTMVTLAPECVPAEFITELTRRGVIVCAGHSNADCETIQTAYTNGVRGVTHLYNAMSQLNSRAPGVVGASLADDNSYAGLIADGHHVASAALRTALKAKGAHRLFLVSDAMVSFATELASFTLFGKDIYVSDGRLTNAEGTLAGAQIDITGAVRFMIEKVGASLEEALAMATSTPAAFLKLENRIGFIQSGLRADFTLLDKNLNVIDSWLAGQSFNEQQQAAKLN